MISTKGRLKLVFDSVATATSPGQHQVELLKSDFVDVLSEVCDFYSWQRFRICTPAGLSPDVSLHQTSVSLSASNAAHAAVLTGIPKNLNIL